MTKWGERIKIKCKTCNKYFYVTPCLKERKYCCMKCYYNDPHYINPMKNKKRLDLSNYNKTRINPNLNKDIFSFHKKNCNCIRCQVARGELIGDKNPAKRPEVRKKISEKTKKRLLKNPEKHPNRILARNGKGSIQQKKIFEFLKKHYDNIEYEYTINTKLGLRFADIAIPLLKIDIEYDGSYWHKDKEKDKQRDKELEEVGWKTIRINQNNIKHFKSNYKNIIQEASK